jgi:hypothetical protein
MKLSVLLVSFATSTFVLWMFFATSEVWHAGPT